MQRSRLKQGACLVIRCDGRENNELRKCTIKRGINRYAEGSCLIAMGQTKVH